MGGILPDFDVSGIIRKIRVHDHEQRVDEIVDPQKMVGHDVAGS